MLQNQNSELAAEVASVTKPKKGLIDQLISFGFDEQLSSQILKMTNNDLDAAIDSLLNFQNGGLIPEQLMSLLDESLPSTSGATDAVDAGKSSADKLKEKIKMSVEQHKAFERLKTDINDMEDDDHLNISLIQEETLLKQYKKVLTE